jgi:hypothetical protein
MIQEWRRVSEGLPSINQYAVWWSEYGLIEPCVAYIAEGEGVEWCSRYTFWFPLPEPPHLPEALTFRVATAPSK